MGDQIEWTGHRITVSAALAKEEQARMARGNPKFKVRLTRLLLGKMIMFFYDIVIRRIPFRGKNCVGHTDHQDTRSHVLQSVILGPARRGLGLPDHGGIRRRRMHFGQFTPRRAVDCVHALGRDLRKATLQIGPDDVTYRPWISAEPAAILERSNTLNYPVLFSHPYGGCPSRKLPSNGRGLLLENPPRMMCCQKLHLRQRGILRQLQRNAFISHEIFSNRSLRKLSLQTRRKHQPQIPIKTNKPAVKGSIMQPGEAQPISHIQTLFWVRTPWKNMRRNQQFANGELRHPASTSEIIEHRVAKEFLPSANLHVSDHMRRAGRSTSHHTNSRSR